MFCKLILICLSQIHLLCLFLTLHNIGLFCTCTCTCLTSPTKPNTPLKKIWIRLCNLKGLHSFKNDIFLWRADVTNWGFLLIESVWKQWRKTNYTFLYTLSMVDSDKKYALCVLQFGQILSIFNYAAKWDFVLKVWKKVTWIKC